MTRLLRLVAWICALQLALLTRRGLGAGQFQMHLSRYLSDGTDAEGQCCGGLCPGSCRTFFRSCLTHVGRETAGAADSHHMRRLDVNTPCSFGMFVSEVVGNNTMAGTLLAHNFTFDFPWPGKFKLIIEAWHTQNGTVPLEGCKSNNYVHLHLVFIFFVFT